MANQTGNRPRTKLSRGRPPYDDVLTPREWEVFELMREGLTNEEIEESSL